LTDESLRLTILGASPAYPNPGGACSGYLVRQRETSVVLDCGSGVAGRLRQWLPLHKINAFVISHLHPDHYFDLVPVFYVLRYLEQLAEPMPLYLPPDGRAQLRRLGDLSSGQPDMFESRFAIREYQAGQTYTVGDLELSFHPVQHYVPSHAIRVCGTDRRMLVFSSDVAPGSWLVDAARNADLLLCEAAILERSQDDPDPTKRGHMTAAEAGEAARDAGAHRLLLTHYRADQEGLREQHQRAAARAFGRPVEMAQEGRTYTV
jgi:ribonuclease BN (tRNA processing enzyme)